MKLAQSTGGKPNRTIRRCLYSITASIIALNLTITPSLAAEPSKKLSASSSELDVYTQRRTLIEKVGELTGIAWNDLAAIDQYERTITIARPKERPKRDGLIGIYFTERQWCGDLNPNGEDQDPVSIAFFHGLGSDGDGDGTADRNNDMDLLFTMAKVIQRKGYSKANYLSAVWNYYQNSRSVERIEQFSRIYAKYDTLALTKHTFPLPLRADISFRSTWGAGRSFGGRRIHEGTDLFAHYGLPVRSTSYGVIEIMGWNRLGGWRVGIRDIHNVYHYYAHLSGFDKKLQRGDIVEPGQIIGWVGSSGYGKPGTQGKFPPHLHYGLYRDSGWSEWAFDPYPYLLRWLREERLRLKADKGGG